jgi:diadenosine tetraphosphate (Ap4A) HIT family hydrolase
MDVPLNMFANNPFRAIAADLPMVAVKGSRNGYIMLATTAEITTYADLPDTLLMAARDWAALLERSGSPRVYWITLSEVTRHLHIHLFPRWPEDALTGIELFESRQSHPQPEWTTAQMKQLKDWANRHGVTLG